MSLTDKQIKALKGGDSRDITKDGNNPLWLIVETTGAKSWQWRGTVAGGRVKRKVGDYPALGLTEARAEAHRLKAEAKAGGAAPPPLRSVPQTVPAVPVDVLTANKAFALYMEHEGDLRNSAKEKRRIWERDVAPVIGHLPLAEVTEEQLDDIVIAKADTSLSMSIAIHALLSRFFNWSRKEGKGRTKLKVNPMINVAKAGTLEERERNMDERELKWFFRALPVCAPYDGIFELALRTGLRRGSSFDIEWPWIEGDVLDLPTTKNGQAFMAWLSPSVLALLPERPEEATGRVWGTRSKFACSKPIDRLNAEMQRLAVLDGWNEPVGRVTLHDFRRTLTTITAGMRDSSGRALIEEHIHDRLLQHKSGTVRNKHYNKYAYFFEKKEALKLWNNYLDGVKKSAFKPRRRKLAA